MTKIDPVTEVALENCLDLLLEEPVETEVVLALKVVPALEVDLASEDLL